MNVLAQRGRDMAILELCKKTTGTRKSHPNYIAETFSPELAAIAWKREPGTDP